MRKIVKRTSKENLFFVLGESYNPGSFKKQLKEILTWKYLLFLFIPGGKNKEMYRRDFELNKFKSKRSFLRRLKPILTIFAIILLFIVTTWAVFANWIVFARWTPAIYFLPG